MALNNTNAMLRMLMADKLQKRTPQYKTAQLKLQELQDTAQRLHTYYENFKKMGYDVSTIEGINNFITNLAPILSPEDYAKVVSTWRINLAKLNEAQKLNEAKLAKTNEERKRTQKQENYYQQMADFYKRRSSGGRTPTLKERTVYGILKEKPPNQDWDEWYNSLPKVKQQILGAFFGFYKPGGNVPFTDGQGLFPGNANQNPLGIPNLDKWNKKNNGK